VKGKPVFVEEEDEDPFAKFAAVLGSSSSGRKKPHGGAGRPVFVEED
jgi:hypothetical protein